MTHNCLEWIPDILCKYHIKYVLECNECIVEPFIDLNFGELCIFFFFKRQKYFNSHLCCNHFTPYFMSFEPALTAA